ncbi:hypothetical protein AB0C44_07990 [Micromonospora taraxaci]|uniref:hypothetical protein n=1 Tax=Micromonospora taraxaci TaxID=1316803 RepID=UPI00340BF829
MSPRATASNVVELFPGAGVVPAPAGPPAHTLDLDAVADRWTDLLDARHRLEQFGRPKDTTTACPLPRGNRVHELPDTTEAQAEHLRRIGDDQ